MRLIKTVRAANTQTLTEISAPVYKLTEVMALFLKGLRFGMLLQFAVGPVCLFILTTAINTNFINALFSVIAVTIVDALYIVIAILGVESIIKKLKYHMFFKILSGLIVLVFGLNIIFNAFGLNIIPYFNIFSINSNNSFLYALILTASNPLTIFFWTGVFSTKVSEDKLNNKDLLNFGFGCISSTLIFLTCISLLGMVFHYSMPKQITSILNIIVGIIITGFSIRIFIKNADGLNTRNERTKIS